MTRADGLAHIAEHFTLTDHHVTHQGRCFCSWRETWTRHDGGQVTEVDVAAFKAAPKGQRHDVTHSGATVRIDIELDTGD